MDINYLLTYAIGIVGALVSYLLQQKDAQQQRDIQDLYRKHEADASALQRLELHVAGEHYKRNELDSRFDRLEESVRSELRDLGKKIDILIEKKTQP